MRPKKIPNSFKSVLWSYNLSRIDPRQAKRTIIVETINHGEWRHWQWIIKAYGKDTIRQLIANIPASEFRPEALALAAAVFGIKKMKYASRSAYIRAQKTLAKG